MIFTVFRRLAIAFGLISAATAPVTADPFVACVQRQLADLGFDPGRTDGALGRATQRAWQEMTAALAVGSFRNLAELPALKRGSAIHWCRELPALDGGLAVHLPSAQQTNMLSDPGLAEKAVAWTYESARKFLRKEYGLVLAGNIGIAASADPKTLRALTRRIKADVSALRSDSDADIKRLCSKVEGYAGAAYQNWLFVCWARPKAMTQAWLTGAKVDMGALMVHEYVHIAQGELSGARTNARSLQAMNHLYGPLWMVEGAAQVIAAQYLKKEVRGFRAYSLSELRVRAGDSGKNLSALRGADSVENGGDYSLSLFAVRILAEIKGQDALFDFWRQLGYGKSWQQAFRDTFGLELQDFERKVMEIQGTPGAARKFIRDVKRGRA